jgi:hypothetical protein
LRFSRTCYKFHLKNTEELFKREGDAGREGEKECFGGNGEKGEALDYHLKFMLSALFYQKRLLLIPLASCFAAARPLYTVIPYKKAATKSEVDLFSSAAFVLSSRDEEDLELPEIKAGPSIYSNGWPLGSSTTGRLNQLD